MQQLTFFQKYKSLIINLLFFIILIVGFGLVLINNKDEIIKYESIIYNINSFDILIIIVITMAASFFRSWRWHFLLLPIKKNISWRNVLRITLNALVANYSTPGKMGIPTKAILLKQYENIPVGKSLPSILGELFIEHSSETALAITCVLMGGHLKKLIKTVLGLFENSSFVNSLLIGMGILLVLAVGSVLFKKKLKTLNFYNKLVEAIHLTRKRPDCIVYSYLVTMINLIVLYYGFWLLIANLGHPEIDFTFVVFAGTITNIVGLISPMPGGLGFRELTIFGLYDFYFGLGGIAFLAIIIMRIITYFALFVLFVLEKVIFHFWQPKQVAEEPAA